MDGLNALLVTRECNFHRQVLIPKHNDVIMSAIASQITSFAIVYSTVYSDVDQRKHQSSASLAFVRGIHRRPVNSPYKWPVTRKMFPFDDIIMFGSGLILRIQLFGFRFPSSPSWKDLWMDIQFTSIVYQHIKSFSDPWVTILFSGSSYIRRWNDLQLMRR